MSLRATWERFVRWWNADTAGWPTFLAIMAVAAFYGLVLA